MGDQLVESFSGIRGVYGESLNTGVAERYARVYAEYLVSNNKGKMKAIAGRDTRKSGPKLHKVFINTFSSFGLEVIDAGVASTPAIEFAVRHYKASGGVIITASHNEPKFNGWKLLGPSGAVLNKKNIGKVIKKVERKIESNRSDKKGAVLNKGKQIRQGYVKNILKIIGATAVQKIRKNNFTILADPNGGPVREILEDLFGKLNVKLIGVNMKQGKFRRTIEPKAETLSYLVPKINRAGAIFGFGLDLDADRMEIVLPSGSEYVKRNGNMISGHEMLALGIESVLAGKKKNNPIVVNNCTSNLIYEIAKKYEAKVVEVDVGETNVVTGMEKYNSLVGGEGSNGGLIVAPTKCRDGILSVAVILALLAKKEQTIEQILSSYIPYFEARVRAKCTKEQDVELKNKLIQHFKKRGFKTRRWPGNVGGIKILYNKDSWLFFRGSQTEPGLFRIIANGKDKKLVKKMIYEGEKVFRQFAR